MIITHKEGQNVSRGYKVFPYIGRHPKRKTNHDSYAIHLAADAWYHPIDKENDWNKGPGKTHSPIFHIPGRTNSSHRNTAMIAWRPVYLEEGKTTQPTNIKPSNDNWAKGFQVTGYFHLNDATRIHGGQHGSDLPIHTFTSNSIVFVDEYHNAKDNSSQFRVHNITGKEVFNIYFTHPVYKVSRLYREIKPWFGGTNPAPKDITYNIYKYNTIIYDSKTGTRQWDLNFAK